MNDLTVVIRWPSSTETLHFGHLQTLRQGAPINSLERWAGYPELTRYKASIEKLRLTRKHCELSIRYAHSKQTGQALENVAWGISKIGIDLQALVATAHWIDDEPEKSPNVVGIARVVTEEDIVDLGRRYVEVQKRRQSAFRKKLLEIDAKCALSGEDTKDALEAAHLVEVKGRGGFGPSNGLLLRADLHRLFDKGLLKIRPDGSAHFPDGTKVSANYAEAAESWKLAPEVLRRVSKRLAERNDA